MAQDRKEKPAVEDIEVSSSPLPKNKKINHPPTIDPSLQLKWGLVLLGEERAREYLAWLSEKLRGDKH